MQPNITLAPGLCRNRDVVLNCEWLVTNGLGGYAMGTVAGANTRADHGYLVAATLPPVERRLLLQHLAQTLIMAGAHYRLGSTEWSTVEVIPSGYDYLQSFSLDGGGTAASRAQPIRR